MITRLRYPKGYQFFDANRKPLALGLLSYYVAGTTTPLNTYSDSGGTVPNGNPIVLDSSGRLQVNVYLGSQADYKEVLKTSSAPISPWPDDNIESAMYEVGSVAGLYGDISASSLKSALGIVASDISGLATVAASGSYNDLSSKPALGTAAALDVPPAGDAAANQVVLGSDTRLGNQASILKADVLSRPLIPNKYVGVRSAGLKHRKALYDLRAGNRLTHRVMVIGDSLAGVSFSTCQHQYARVAASHFPSLPIYCPAMTEIWLDSKLTPEVDVLSVGGDNVRPRTYTATIIDKAEYYASWIGSNIKFGSGQYCIYSYEGGGNSTYADRMIIPIITEPGAGSVKIEIASNSTPPAVDSGLWRAPAAGEITSSHALTGSDLIVNASGGALGVNIVTLALAFGQWALKITQTTGGNVRVLPPMLEITSKPAINYFKIGTASNDFTNSQSSANPIMAAIIKEYNPDVLFVTSDDRLAAYQRFLPMLENALSLTGLTENPVVILDGNPFYRNLPYYFDADIAARINYCWDWVDARIGWDVIDGMQLAGGYAEANRVGWGSDGIHYAQGLAWEVMRQWAVSRGLMNYSAVQTATVSDLVRSAYMKYVPSNLVHALLAAPAVQDTAVYTWSYLTTSSGSGTRTASSITLGAGATAGSTVVAYINEGGSSPINPKHGYRYTGLPGGFSTRARVPVGNATGVLRLVWRGDVGYNAAHAGALTNEGFGFKISNNVVQGIAWNGTAEAATTGSVSMTSGGTGDYYDLQVVLSPKAVTSQSGTAEFFVDNVSIGAVTYRHASSLLALRAELTNGGTPADYQVNFSPFKIVTVK
jgi:hypothetical protein